MVPQVWVALSTAKYATTATASTSIGRHGTWARGGSSVAASGASCVRVPSRSASTAAVHATGVASRNSTCTGSTGRSAATAPATTTDAMTAPVDQDA